MTVAARPLSALALAEKSVPRYTSYPTAPHFSTAVDSAVAEDWLAALDPATSLSLYIHQPYCAQICAYCGCNAKAAKREQPLDAYTATAETEIRALAGRTRARKVRHIHWGGGTPSLIGSARFERLMAALRESFDLSGVVEHAIELDPRTVTDDFIAALARQGVTRASLGVQDMNLHVQEAIGRVQPYETVARVVEALRAGGVDAINLDLMYGLPKQSLDDVRETARLAAGLKPSRLAIFGYAHVPWFKVHQRLIDAAALPGAAERLAQAQAAQETLEANGYVAIGLDHFALPQDDMALAMKQGRLRRNFQGYTTDEAQALIGIGPSSIGHLPQGFLQNAPDIAGWTRKVEAGRVSVVKGVAVTQEDRVRSDLIERLMCDFAVDYGHYAQRLTGERAGFDEAQADLDALAAEGLLAHDRAARRVAMSERGRPFVRLAAAAFDARLRAASPARHSAAV
jgi:oxygen-independent coproporphyrinogen-3 oxidase